jgi:hypothetical protein
MISTGFDHRDADEIIVWRMAASSSAVGTNAARQGRTLPPCGAVNWRGETDSPRAERIGTLALEVVAPEAP